MNGMDVGEQVRRIALGLGIGNRYKFELSHDGKIAISYQLEGKKYLLTLEPYPYER